MDYSPRNGRDDESLRRHYLLERELADRLRAAPAGVRKAMYRTVYDELFRRVPDHPQHTRKADPAVHQARTQEQLGLLARYLRPESAFAEIGAGDCHLTMAVARRARRAYGVDVADVIAASAQRPGNFELLLSDGTAIPLPDGSVDVVYSNMLIEHLHPDDAAEHAGEVRRVLAPGGVYVCRTVHRHAGPQDVSQYFDEVATGLHLKEYTYGELRALFLRSGFATTSVRPRMKGRSLPAPQWALIALERALTVVPHSFRRRLCRSRLLRPMFSTVTVVGHKSR